VTTAPHADRAGPSTRWRVPARAGALLLPLATCGILSTLRESITAATAVLILVLWVVGASASGDRVAGVLAALSGAVWFDFFLTEPYERFTIADSDDLEAAVLLVLIGLGVTEIALWGHRQHARAAERSGYLEGVLGAARIVSEGDAPVVTVVDVVGRQIASVLGADTCLFVAGPIHDTRVAVLDHDGMVTRGEHTVDVDRVGLPHDEYTGLLVRRGSRLFGHFLVSATSQVTYPTSEQRQVAVLLADQVAGVLDNA
jgi:K+-sensing histidine kinase KdpD